MWRSTLAILCAARVAHADDPDGEVIEVSGKAPDETKPLSYSLSADEIRDMPGAGNDILRAVQALPGVARIPFGFGGLVLRGTSPRDTAVYLDGIEVPIAFHFGGITSFYPSGMLADLQLTSGGFGVEYGRAQGGIVKLTTREPRTDAYRLGGSIGLLDSGATAEGPWHGGGFMIGVRRSYFDTVVSPFVASDIPLPSYWDAQLRLSFGDPAKHGRISPMVFLSIDHVANHTTGAPGQPEGIAMTSMFVRAAAPYLRTWGPLTLRVVPWLGTNRLTFEDIQDGRAETFSRPVYPYGVRADLTRDEPWGDLRGGLDVDGGYLSHTQVGFTGAGEGPMQTNGSSTVAWSDLAGWTEARLALDGERFAIKPGVRVEAYGLTGEVVVDPRLNIHQQLTKTIALRQAIGRFHQPPTPGDVDRHDGNPALDSSWFDQFSLGVEIQHGGWFGSLTGFYAYGQHLGIKEARPTEIAEPNLGGLGPTFELLLEKQLGFAIYRDDVGRARNAGLELLVKRHTGPWFGMLSYTLSIAQRTDDPRFDNGWRPFELDQRHNLNALGSVAVAHWRFGARVQLVSGNPYSPTNLRNPPEQIPWGGTLPLFFQLDLRADRTWHRGWGDIDLYLDVQNVTNRRNVEGREYGYDDAHPSGADLDTPGLPIVPFLGVDFIPR
ncbi:MAG TPA: TonB-dependent receptor [Kofleriaceae bacterium]|nr:TonB-dependent receptor [Kofleriaceae bacterium]